MRRRHGRSLGHSKLSRAMQAPSEDVDMAGEESEEEPELSAYDLPADTFALLQSQLAQRGKKWVDGGEGCSEDFRRSQFWYSEETGRAIMQEALAATEAPAKVAILSAPSLMQHIKDDPGAMARVTLFELDERFGLCYPDNFHSYDYRQPECLPPQVLGTVDTVVLDPPYLNVDTLKEFYRTAKLLSRTGSVVPKGTQQDREHLTRCIVMTASVLRDDVYVEFGLQPTTLKVTHQSKLSNPLYCYTNYKPVTLELEEERQHVPS